MQKSPHIYKYTYKCKYCKTEDTCNLPTKKVCITCKIKMKKYRINKKKKKLIGF